MANTKLRNIQFYRNGQASVVTGDTVVDLKSAYKQAEQDFITTGRYNDMLDGEILLYRFSYNGTVHTLVGVVHVSGGVHSLEVLANYDMLGGEISAAITAELAKLTVENVSVATESDNVVTFNGIKQTNGKIETGTTGISLAKVAKTGAAADVSIKNTNGLFKEQTTNVQVALEEIAAEIDGMDLTVTDVVALNTGKTALQAGKISETDGKVAVADAETLVEFNQALINGNKVATMADVTTAQNNATVVGEKAIEVKAATGEGATGKVVSLKINSNDKVLTQNADGLLANISLTYDTDAKEIKLLGKNDENAAPVVISTIDADDFVKDGMLQSAELVEIQETGVTTEVPYLKFTWNADSGIQITRISVKKFIDTYTSGDLNTLTVSGYTITPKTEEIAVGKTGLAVAGDVATAIAATKGQDIQTITGETATTQGNYIDVKVSATKGANDDNYTLSTTSNVTTQAVSTATSTANGLATASDVKTYVDNKVGATYTATGELTMSDGRVITHNTKTGLPTDAKGSVSTDTINVPVITVNEYGHVTALDQQSYTVKYPTVSGTEGRIKVESTTGENGVVNYAVDLATVSRTDTNTAKDNFSDESNTFTFISGVTTDNYGRVTGVSTTTMTENWDCGTWE